MTTIEIPKYTIKIASILTGIAPHTIRRAELAGILSPSRTDGGQRIYTDNEIAVLKRYAELDEMGVNTVQSIKVILRMEKLIE